MNQSKSRFSKWHLNSPSAKSGRVSARALVLLLSATITLAKAGEHKGTSVPQIANIAGIKVGYSSMAELERHLGKGRVTVGGHSNGARLWRVKGTSWIIYADAFEYSERGDVVDGFAIRADWKPGDCLAGPTVDPRPGQPVPYARLTRHELAWAGAISPGINENKLLKLLRQKSWTPIKIADGWQVEARGYSPLTSDPLSPYRQWRVTFTMKENSLVGINLAAMQERTPYPGGRRSG